MINYNLVYQEVNNILGQDKSGHGMDHVLSVVNNAKQIMKNLTDDYNEEIVLLACYLHDVDDYKIVGIDKAEKFINAYNILNKLNIEKSNQEKIIHIIKNMGYSKFLAGVRPTNIEGQIVSDADMLEAIGAKGIARTIAYNTVKGNAIFNINLIPQQNLDVAKYKNSAEPCINHFFEKLLRIKNLMLTKPAQQIAQKRHSIMYNFLENYFEEHYEDCSNWQELLKQYK
jgi:uncharacterized protein